jgi:2-dehydropantoate 2-reductase
MNVLIFGAGAIGSHIAYCMYKTGHVVNLVCRGKHYVNIRDNGLIVQINNNEKLESEALIKQCSEFNVVDNINKVNDVEYSYVFITVKLSSYNEDTLRELQPYMGKETAVITPCTKMPFWWFYNLKNSKYKDIDFDHSISKFFYKENIIMMTMWLSAVIKEPGHIVIKHTQRGYPLCHVHSKMEKPANKLRSIFNETCISPIVENIRSEIYIKSINSLAFNVVALDREFDNLQLSQNQKSVEEIRTILQEGEQILNKLNLPIVQNIDDRIRQTLSSKNHTMSMLHDYQNGKQVELSYIWDGFCKICNVLDINMSFTKAVVERVLYKVNSNLDNDKDLS